MAFKSEGERKNDLSNRLESLIKAFKGGRFTDETFSLIEIEIKRIQSELLEIEIVKELTQPAEAVEPTIEAEAPKTDENVLKAIMEFNNIFKK